ncbi:hypothetical protein SSX86_000268 [Deinandra increscens subsp. villosa]|uniref:SWIM-type domain-containing protein n=1 Tax=Deinandra increscens subsp. villosa TaxID=3103831 RepID=A0AAP0DW75_9ASTR
MKPTLGMKFESPTQLKDSMIDYGVSNGYQLKFPVNDYKRLLVRCGEEETDDENDEKDEEGKKDEGDEKDEEDGMGKKPDNIKKKKKKSSKKKALNDYEGGLKEHYSKLSDYGAEILLTNPGSTVKMVVNEDANRDIYFSSYYICFKGVKDGWMNGCRKIIGLDGCFIKTGQLLSAIGRDANNHIFPLAWAVVSVENKENWKWFLDLLKGDVEMECGIGLTLISDQHKGIVEAVKDVFPYAEHRQCTRHIYANFNKKFRGIDYKNLFWGAAKSTTEQQFEAKMNELKAISEEAYSHLIERNPKSWSRAFFEVDRACDAFENDMSESFNSCIRVARRKPIITMLEEIRMFVMQRSFTMSTKAEKVEHDVCPTVRKKLELIKLEQRHWKVIPSDNIIFEVRNEKDAYAVNVNEQTCSCRSWQLSGIPCVHTVAALAFINKDPENYINKWLKRDMFKEAYKYHIKPLKGSSSWPKERANAWPAKSKEKKRCF